MKANVELVEPKCLTIDISSTGAPMAVGTEGDEVVILMRLTLRPGNNMMNVDFDISTSGDGAAVSRLDKDTSPQFSGYWRAPISAT